MAMFSHLGMSDSSYAAAPCATAEDEVAAAERRMQKGGAVAIAAAGLLAVVGSAAWLGGSTSESVSNLRQVPPVDELAFDEKWGVPFISSRCGTAEASSKCGEWENNTEYQVDGGWYTSLDHVPSAEMCCAMCQGAAKCKAFTWVKNAGLDGCASQCWLKGGEPTKKHHNKEGFVSGMAPVRPAMPVREPLALVPKGGQDSMFCWSLVVPGSYEEELLKFQQKEKASIFACDAWSVYSNLTKNIGQGITTSAVNTSLVVSFGGDSNTALNSWIFIAVWKKVIDERWHDDYSWSVKVDPDAVFFPERLRPIVAAHRNAGYINNCKYGLHGPIEVIAASTLVVLEADYKASFDGKAPKQCVEKLNFGEWGEDFFLSRCMWEVHHITKELDESLMCEAHCDCNDWYWCDRPDAVTFHPFKRPDMYKQCMANSLASRADALAKIAKN